MVAPMDVIFVTATAEMVGGTGLVAKVELLDVPVALAASVELTSKS
jgi:hypothetical protein